MCRTAIAPFGHITSDTSSSCSAGPPPPTPEAMGPHSHFEGSVNTPSGQKKIHHQRQPHPAAARRMSAWLSPRAEYVQRLRSSRPQHHRVSQDAALAPHLPVDTSYSNLAPHVETPRGARPSSAHAPEAPRTSRGPRPSSANLPTSAATDTSQHVPWWSEHDSWQPPLKVQMPAWFHRRSAALHLPPSEARDPQQRKLAGTALALQSLDRPSRWRKLPASARAAGAQNPIPFSRRHLMSASVAAADGAGASLSAARSAGPSAAPLVRPSAKLSAVL